MTTQHGRTGRARPGVELRTANLADAYLEGRRLTERDRWLIELLAEHRVLTVDQISALAFEHVRRARRRLRLLVRRGVLARFRRPLPAGSQPWRYTLGVLGEHLHAARTGAPMPRPAKVAEKITRLAESRNLDHLLGLNGFFVALAAHARTHPGSELSLWWSERRTAEATKDHVRPDGFGAWTEHHTSGQPVQVRFFVEYDRGRERHDQLIDKLTRYAGMSRADVDRPILFVFTTTARETNFTRHATAAGWPRHLLIATTATDQHTPTQPPPTGPLHPPGPVLSPAERVWLPLGATHRRRLIELADRGAAPPSATGPPPHPPHPPLPPPAHPPATYRPPHAAA